MFISKIPPELSALILEQLDSPQALHCAISASPVFYQAFNASRTQVLISVFQRAILPSARKDALAAIYCPSISTEDNLGDLWEFLEAHFRSDQAILPFPIDNPAITGLMKLVTRVLRLERDYFNDTISNLAEAPGGDISERKLLESPDPLSNTERTRIQRAFLRLELYCQCFPISKDDIGMEVSLVPAELQFHHFLHRLQPWEVEEISCIHQYLSFRVGALIEQIQNEIVAIVFRHQVQGLSSGSSNSKARISMMDKLLPYPGSASEMPPIDSGKLPDGQLCKVYELRTFSYWRGSPIFTLEGRQEFYEFLSSLVSRGLEYLISVFDADKELQRYLLLSGEYTLREFLAEAINYAMENDLRSNPQREGSHTQQENATPESGIESSTDDTSRAGCGYLRLFSERSRSQYRPLSYVRNYSIPYRRLGYVFWDSSRFGEVAVQARISYSWENCWDEHERFDFKEKASAEEVLMDVEIPKSVMDDLNWTYGFWKRGSSNDGKQITEK